MPSASTSWASFTASQIDLLAAVLLEFVRDQARRVPPPRGMPFLGLDHPEGELTPYESLAARGIFRKYETVLLLGAGFGGAARWCHVHFGCEVVGVTGDAAIARAATALSQRARASAHTRFLTSSAEALPFQERRFTHVWAIEGWADVAPGDPRLAELFRAVRLGGLAAVQQTGAAPGWASRASEALTSVGFAEARAAIVERPVLRESIRRARDRFLQALRAWPDAQAVATAEALERLYGESAHGGRPVTQVVGRRPS